MDLPPLNPFSPSGLWRAWRIASASTSFRPRILLQFIQPHLAPELTAFIFHPCDTFDNKETSQLSKFSLFLFPFPDLFLAFFGFIINLFNSFPRALLHSHSLDGHSLMQLCAPVIRPDVYVNTTLLLVSDHSLFAFVFIISYHEIRCVSYANLGMMRLTKGVIVIVQKTMRHWKNNKKQKQ